VHVGDLAGDVQAEPRAARRPRARAVAADPALDQARQLLLGDARPVVGDAEREAPPAGRLQDDGDVAALERVLTPDFTLTLSNGEVSTRADEINELQSKKVHYDVFENYDMLARLYGNDTAVVVGKTRVKGTADGKPFDRVVQFTDTLIKRDGRWQLAAGHVSRLEK